MARAFTLSVVCSLAACAVAYGCSSDPSAPPPEPQIETDSGVPAPEDSGPIKTGCAEPGSFDVPGNDCDDDGDGTVDNTPTCDDALPPNGDAVEFAKALGICQTVAKNGFGLISAEYTQGYGVTAPPVGNQHGIFPKFGSVLVAREGKRLGVLSTGFAEEFNGHIGKTFGGGDSMSWSTIAGGGGGKAPPGFPRPVEGCDLSETVQDVINLKLTLRAPVNATGFRFDFNFLSSEWPAFICSQFNDAFIAYLTAKGFNGGVADNVSFDPNKSSFSVNSTFFDRCTAGVQTGCQGTKQAQSVCPGGPGELAGTGFGVEGLHCGATSTSGGATGWLTSRAPVTPGEVFTIELMIWDTGDGSQDSTVLLDNFTWLRGDITAATERPAL